MKKTLYAAAAFAAATTAAAAADLPSRKGPLEVIVPPPAISWSGFYVGLNAGYAFNNSDSTFHNAATFPPFLPQIGQGATGVVSVKNDGFIGGGQIGYNRQWSNFVVGVEADIQGIANTSSTGSAVTVVPHPAPGAFFTTALSSSKSLDYFGTVRGRIGYLLTPTLLVYGTGGLAYGGVNLSGSTFQTLTAFPGNPGIAGSTLSDTRVGWTAGGGVEWMFLHNWSAKVEYLYYDLGTVTTPGSFFTYPNAASVVGAVNHSARFDGHIVRAGVNYHFCFGGAEPVLAKY